MVRRTTFIYRSTCRKAEHVEQRVDAEQANEDIDNTEAQDENEQIINRIYLKILRYSIDSLSEVDSTFIVELANQCPYIGGSAVFKARSLITIYYPSSLFDDLKLCSDVGVYKQSSTNNSNAKSIISKENEYLQQIVRNELKAKIISDEFAIYPNPTDGQIAISYNMRTDSWLNIIDIAGRVVKVIYLAKENNKVIVNINELSVGLYTYSLGNKNLVVRTGKLIKE